MTRSATPLCFGAKGVVIFFGVQMLGNMNFSEKLT